MAWNYSQKILKNPLWEMKVHGKSKFFGNVSLKIPRCIKSLGIYIFLKLDVYEISWKYIFTNPNPNPSLWKDFGNSFLNPLLYKFL